MKQGMEDVYLATIEASLEAQLKAVRQLRRKQDGDDRQAKKGRSQLSIVFDVLKDCGKPLHITEIIARAKSDYQFDLDRESIVSSLSKKVLRKDTYVRTDKNTFALLEDGDHGSD